MPRATLTGVAVTSAIASTSRGEGPGNCYPGSNIKCIHVKSELYTRMCRWDHECIVSMAGSMVVTKPGIHKRNELNNLVGTA
jgi:hypothetical protein